MFFDYIFPQFEQCVCNERTLYCAGRDVHHPHIHYPGTTRCHRMEWIDVEHKHNGFMNEIAGDMTSHWTYDDAVVTAVKQRRREKSSTHTFLM